jgi:hypothetical protein
LDDNVDGNEKYARWWKYPSSGDAVREWIEDAFQARTSRAHLIDNSRARKEYNSQCP